MDKDILAKNEVRHYGEAVAGRRRGHARDRARGGRPHRGGLRAAPARAQPHGRAQARRASRASRSRARTTTCRVFSPQPGTNIPNLSKFRKGDVEKGFAESEWIVEREYTNPSVQHVPMETHVAIVEWKNGDEVTIWTSAQSPFTVRNLFCYTFKLPLNKVRVIVPHVGGGFGGKAGIHLEPLVACLSRKAGGMPGQAAGHARGGVQPPALQQRPDVQDQDRRARRRKDSRPAADPVLGRGRVCRLRGQRHARLRATRARGPTRSPTSGSTPTRSTRTSPTARPTAGSGTWSSSGASSATWSSLPVAIGMDPLEFRKKNLLKPGSITHHRRAHHGAHRGARQSASMRWRSPSITGR